MRVTHFDIVIMTSDQTITPGSKAVTRSEGRNG